MKQYVLAFFYTFPYNIVYRLQSVNPRKNTKARRNIMFRKLSVGLLACLLVASLASSVCADSKTSMVVPRVADGSITIDGVKAVSIHI